MFHGGGLLNDGGISKTGTGGYAHGSEETTKRKLCPRIFWKYSQVNKWINFLEEKTEGFFFPAGLGWKRAPCKQTPFLVWVAACNNLNKQCHCNNMYSTCLMLHEGFTGAAQRLCCNPHRLHRLLYMAYKGIHCRSSMGLWLTWNDMKQEGGPTFNAPDFLTQPLL